MAVQKPQGSQIDIQSVAADISNDATAIGSIATGVTSDPGAQATMDADYLRVDGTNEAGVALFTNDANYQGQVVPGTTGDFAALDASGNIIDSGVGSADFATAAQGLTADSALQDITAEPIGDLSDVDNTTPADRHVLVYDGVTDNRYENRLLVKADVSDFSDGDYATAAQGTTADSAVQPSDNVSDLTNDAGYASSFDELSDTPADYTGGVAGHYVRVNSTPDGVEFTDELAAGDGAVGTPSIGFASDNDTGLYWPGADSIAIAVGGNKALEIESDGTVNVNGTTDYETLVTADDDIPNKKYVDDKTWDAGDITTGTFADALVAQSNVTQHEAALTITESQISDLQAYLTAEVNDLTAAVTWANVPDGNITQSSVTQHEGALSIGKAQITDLGVILQANNAGSPYTLVNEFLVVVDATAGNVTINLPTAATGGNTPFNIKRIDATANTVAVVANGVETIDGLTTQNVVGQYTNLTIMSDGAAWHIL